VQRISKHVNAAVTFPARSMLRFRYLAGGRDMVQRRNGPAWNGQGASIAV